MTFFNYCQEILYLPNKNHAQISCLFFYYTCFQSFLPYTFVT
ncbi:hypothetical protein HMPREF9963_1121 [Streptococcus dysgalactiae subsp. equisimilis SK1250]|nr:hypothetical protein HMPREF9963_1121 [Streptococcus dysgalactiae subsp. equisimilis SK1250]